MASRSEDSFELLGRDNSTSEGQRNARLDAFDAVPTTAGSSKVPTTALNPAALSALQHAAPSTAGTDDNINWVAENHSIATSAIQRAIEDAGVSVNAMDSSADAVAAAPGPSKADMNHWDRQAASGNIMLCPYKFPLHVNIMMYGDDGLGKTTCIRNLIGMDSHWKIKHQGAAFGPAAGSTGISGKTSLQQFKDDSDSFRIELEPVWDGQSNIELHFSFQEVPGWGDSIDLVDSLKMVVEFLLHQRQMDYISNGAGHTEYDPLPGAKMTRGITICLYFLPPHSVKTIDWVMMAAISKLVAVVPVIAKADTFTPQELEKYRKEILQVIHHSQHSATTGGQLCPDPLGAAASSPANPEHPHVSIARELSLQTYSFKKSDLEQVGASGEQVPPFAIVSSQDVLTAEQVHQFGGERGDPCRAYTWGAVFPFDRRHSNLITLKQLLCGHRNAAIHDLLRDSWTRAHTFAKQFKQQLATKGFNCMTDCLAEVAASDAGLLQPLVDEVCSSLCAGGSELKHKLRTEEHLAATESLRVARAEKDSLAAELQQLTCKKDDDWAAAAAAATKEHKAALESLRVAQAEKDSLVAELQQLSHERDDLAAAASEAESNFATQHKAVVESLRVAEADKDSLVAELQQLTREKDKLAAAASASTKKHGAAIKSLRVAEAEKDSLVAELQQLTLEKDKLADAASAATEEHEAAIEGPWWAQEKNDRLKAEPRQLRREKIAECETAMVYANAGTSLSRYTQVAGTVLSSYLG